MLSLAVVLLMSVGSSMARSEPYPPAIEYRYEAFTDLVNFADARAKCTAAGGELAVPESKAEEAGIAAAVSAVDGAVDWKSTQFSDYKFYWLNIEEDEDDEPLTELTYTNYHKSQPNRATEKCVAAAATKENQWSDRPCDAVTPYVCQFENIDMKCWRNKIPQGLTKLEGTNDVLDKYNYKKRADAIIKCQVAAQEGGYNFFALGNGGQCWAGHGEDYKLQGQVEKCPAHGKGKYAVVNVYAIITAPTTPAPSTTATAQYRYEAFADLVNFATAQDKCTAAGGELAVPESKAEEASIAAAVSAVDGAVDWKSTQFSTYKFYWLNIEEDVDNAPLTELTYTNYHKSQPNRATEKCVAAAATRGNQWSDRPCDAVTPYVCQYDLTKTTTPAPPPTTTEPTHKCGRTGRCKTLSQYCSSGKCKSLRPKGKFCTSDRQCKSKDCAWYLSCK